MAGHVFISHSTVDDELVARLRSVLERLGYSTWVDSRRLAAGDVIDSEIRRSIAEASHLLALLSVNAVNSAWVSQEIELGLAEAAARPGFKVIPLLVPPLEPASLRLFFPKGQIPRALHFDPQKQQVVDVLADLRAALGGSLPEDQAPLAQPAAAPLGELVVELDQLAVVQDGGERRAAAVATLRWTAPGTEPVSSRQFKVRSPLGPIEAGELAWYLEQFAIWPGKHFETRAKEVESNLLIWGSRLFEVLDHAEARKVWEAFGRAPAGLERLVSIYVDPEPMAGSSKEEEASSREAATLWLGLPWELLRDERGFLAEGARGCRLRRRLPNRDPKPPLVTTTPIRVLVVSPRPEDDRAGYIDHRISARPLVEAFVDLGDRAEVELLGEATLPGLSRALREALDAGRPFHAVHFDGHGIYDRHVGLGALLFEDPADRQKLTERRSQEVDARKLAETLRDHRVALVVLEACQSAMSKEDPMASVAGQLLAGGVASVVAMSHSVLVATAWRFVESFYGQLSRGATVGKALLEGQRRLREEPGRGRGFHGELLMQDWFVPVLYQETLDPQLVRELPAKRTVEEIRGLLERAVEGLKERRPEHGFIGRSRELLALERLLFRERYAVLVGEGGEGKTTLAVELARWLVVSQCFDQASFVSVEDSLAQNARALLSRLGNQLVAKFDAESGADFERGRQLVERALRDRATLIVVDNVESMLGDLGSGLEEPEVLAAALKLLEGFTRIGATRIVFTSRSPLPAPFGEHVVRLGRLGKKEAIELVAKVLEKERWRPAGEESQKEVEELVEAAGCHARGLELLAREVAKTGVRFAAEKMGELMHQMAARHPDDRERSLFASVELSLRRLPAATRARLPKLGVFQGGGNAYTISEVLGLDLKKGEVNELFSQLIEVGLAEMKEYGHLRLDPALGPALLRELGEPERQQAQAAWVEAMVELTNFLYQQHFEDAQLAATLTLLELPNLLAALAALAASADPERVVEVATSLEPLLQTLGRPRALAQVVEVRERAAKKLGNWSHALFEAESAAIDRLLGDGRFQQAVEQAQRLLSRAQAAGEGAYPGAAYDLAMASARLGRALKMGGAAAAALAPVKDARERFGQLAAAGNKDAERMASVCLTEIGDCLMALGQLDEAAAAYEMRTREAAILNDLRGVATGKGQLGTVRLLQRRYPEALAAQSEARDSFEKLGEPAGVATAWHLIGVVHQEAGQPEAAERAYQQSLAIELQLGNRPGEALTLNQLGILYSAMGRLEEAVRFYRDSATVFAEVGDGKNEGFARNNVADKLVKLGRFTEARQELERAIECKRPFGHAALPWTTFDILHDLEVALGNGAAAAAARQQAEAAFLAYRLDGGENHTGPAQLVAAVGRAITAGQVGEMGAMLDQIGGQAGLPQWAQVLIPALKKILAGSRDPALAADPALYYADAVELRLLLAGLSQKGS